jgi:hypothetical protein
MALFSLDWALLAQSIGTDVTLLFTDGIAEFTKLKEQLTCVGDLVDITADETDVLAYDAISSGVTQFQSDIDAAEEEDEDEEENLEEPTAADEYCGINYYEAGKTSGRMFSRLLMQKLEESKLP